MCLKTISQISNRYLRNLMEIWQHSTKILDTKRTESRALKCTQFSSMIRALPLQICVLP